MKRLLLLFSFLLVSSSGLPADVSLAWDHSASTNVSGYKVYFGKSSRVYGTPIIIGYQSTYTVAALGPGGSGSLLLQPLMLMGMKVTIQMKYLN